MVMNASGPISLGGIVTGQSINIEIGNAYNTIVSLNDTAVRHLSGQTTAGSPVIMPTNFYGTYYKYLVASTNPYYAYNYSSGQGGYQNGGGSCLAGGDPSYATDINGGWRVGNPYYPTSYQGNGSPCQWWTVNLDPNNFTELSTLYTLMSSGAASAMWSNVTWVSNTGTTQSFTATLNTGYYAYISNNSSITQALMNPGQTYTFYVDSTRTSMGIGTGNIYAGTFYLTMFTANGGIWTNDTNAPGTINVLIDPVGVGKLGGWRVTIDGTVVYSVLQGDSGCGGKDYGLQTLGPYNITATSSVLVEQYWWGCGNFSYGQNYINGGYWKVGATLTTV